MPLCAWKHWLKKRHMDLKAAYFAPVCKKLVQELSRTAVFLSLEPADPQPVMPKAAPSATITPFRAL